MSDLNLKEKIEIQIAHWVQVVRDFEDDINSMDSNSKEFHSTAKRQAEYKGRIYAARFFEGLLGFMFDTDFTSIK